MDSVVAPSFAGFRGVRLQQNPRLHQPLRRAASFPGQCRKLLTFLAAQPHNIFLYDNFPCSHDRLRRSVATKANDQILSNWLKRTSSLLSAGPAGKLLARKPGDLRATKMQAKAQASSLTSRCSNDHEFGSLAGIVIVRLRLRLAARQLRAFQEHLASQGILENELEA